MEDGRSEFPFMVLGDVRVSLISDCIPVVVGPD